MTPKKLLLSSLICSAFAATAAHAQGAGGTGATGSGPSGAASAARGELSTPNQDKGGMRAAAGTSATSRDQVKADARAGNNMPKGELSTANQDKGGMRAASGSGTGKKAKHSKKHSTAMSSTTAPATPSDPAVSKGERTPPEQRKDIARP